MSGERQSKKKPICQVDQAVWDSVRILVLQIQIRLLVASVENNLERRQLAVELLAIIRWKREACNISFIYVGLAGSGWEGSESLYRLSVFLKWVSSCSWLGLPRERLFSVPGITGMKKAIPGNPGNSRES